MTERTSPPFGPIVTAAITPFADDGGVDYESFWRMLKFLADNGSDAVLVTGTTGESPTLSDIEKLSLYKTAVEAVGGSMHVIAGTGTYDTKESVELTAEAFLSEWIPRRPCQLRFDAVEDTLELRKAREHPRLGKQ